jgi:hypothetical protein
MRRDSRRTSGSLELLQACDPVRRSALGGERIEAALDEIGAAITSRLPQAARATRRRSIGARHRVFVVAAVMLAIGAGIAAGAVVVGAHTVKGVKTRFIAESEF